MKKKYALSLYGLLGLLIIVLDRITKGWALGYAADAFCARWGDLWIACDVVYNRGISWGLLNDGDGNQFKLVSGGVIIITLLVLGDAIMRYRNRRCIAGHALVIAGSLSNIFDRYAYAGVIDFIHMGYGDYSWPIFNIADVCIIVGAVLMVMTSLRD